MNPKKGLEHGQSQRLCHYFFYFTFKVELLSLFYILQSRQLSNVMDLFSLFFYKLIFTAEILVLFYFRIEISSCVQILFLPSVSSSFFITNFRFVRSNALVKSINMT